MVTRSNDMKLRAYRRFISLIPTNQYPVRSLIGVGVVIVVLVTAGSWLIFGATGGSVGSPASSEERAKLVAAGQERAKLVAAGQELVISPDQRPVAPPIQLQTASFGDGSVFNLTEEQGSVVVLFFMAAWCPTCVPESRALARLHEDYADRGVRIIVLDVDQRETEEHLRRFRARAGNGRHLWAMDSGYQVAKPYRVRSLDTTVVIDQEGRVAFGDVTPTPYRTLASVIEALLP